MTATNARRITRVLCAVAAAMTLAACDLVTLFGPTGIGVTTFTLVDPRSGRPVPGFDPLVDGQVVDIAAIGTPHLSIRANTVGRVNRVHFTINGGESFFDAARPYALKGNRRDGGYVGWAPTLGEHLVAATPYQDRAARRPGRGLTVRFRVADSFGSPGSVPAASPPATGGAPATPTAPAVATTVAGTRPAPAPGGTAPSTSPPSPAPTTAPRPPAPIGDAAPAPAAPGSRDVFQRPFRSRSIWNMPIGSGAQYVHARIPQASHVGLDDYQYVRTRASDPAVRILEPGSWSRRCSGSRDTGYTVQLPADFLIPDASPPHTPNSLVVFVMPDGVSTLEVAGAARCTPGGPLYAYVHGDPAVARGSLRGDGRFGGHGASFLSAIGGAIRPGELTGPEPIRHALDLLIWGKHIWWPGSMAACPVWPASACDAYAAPDGDPVGDYYGTNPVVRMGALFAIPPSVTPEQLGITTAVGRKLFDALRDYGAYLTDNAAWDGHYLGVDRAALGTFPWGNAERADVNRLVAALHVVVNNGPNSIGGGGTPRQPLLPDV